jgi:hypothetical protein
MVAVLLALLCPQAELPSVAARRRLGAVGLPGGMPQAHGLAGDAELAGDLSLANADGEQLGALPVIAIAHRRLAQLLRHRSGAAALSSPAPLLQPAYDQSAASARDESHLTGAA